MPSSTSSSKNVTRARGRGIASRKDVPPLKLKPLCIPGFYCISFEGNKQKDEKPQAVAGTTTEGHNSGTVTTNRRRRNDPKGLRRRMTVTKTMESGMVFGKPLPLPLIEIPLGKTRWCKSENIQNPTSISDTTTTLGSVPNTVPLSIETSATLLPIGNAKIKGNEVQYLPITEKHKSASGSVEDNSDMYTNRRVRREPASKRTASVGSESEKRYTPY